MLLLQPVFTRHRGPHAIEREVVIVMDDSASMHLKDLEVHRKRRAGRDGVRRLSKESGLLDELEGKVVSAQA